MRVGELRTADDAGFGATDTCTFFTSMPLQIHRGGAFLFGAQCALVDDRDPTNTGVCSGGPSAYAALTRPQAIACVTEILASQAYAASCAP